MQANEALRLRRSVDLLQTGGWRLLNYLCTELLSHSGVRRTRWPWWSSHAPLHILWTQNAHGCLLQPIKMAGLPLIAQPLTAPGSCMNRAVCCVIGADQIWCLMHQIF